MDLLQLSTLTPHNQQNQNNLDYNAKKQIAQLFFFDNSRQKKERGKTKQRKNSTETFKIKGQTYLGILHQILNSYTRTKTTYS